MNILFLTTHINTGGISSYLYTLSKGLIKRGHGVCIVSSGGNMQSLFEELGVKLFKLNIKTKSELSPRIYSALKEVEQIIHDEKIDIIHAHTRITQVMSHLLSKKLKVPYISTCHGYFKVRWSRKMFPCWGDAVTAISKPVADHLTDDFKINTRKVKLIESGIDVDLFDFQNAQVRQKQRNELGLESNKVIGLIARLSDVKGQDILISSMKKVIEKYPDAKLLLVGQGKMEEELRRQVNALELGGHVIFLPTINRTSEILPIFDIFAMPSRAEGLGLSIMEAQAAGVPCVASNVGGLPALIKHKETGMLVEKENPEELAEAIIELIGNDELRNSIARNARSNIEDHWSSDKMVNKMIRLYEELVKGQ